MLTITNFFLALPSVGFIILAFLFLAGVFLSFYKQYYDGDTGRVKGFLRDTGLFVACVMFIMAVMSPTFMPKNDIDKFKTDQVELKLEDEVRSAQETKDRVPKPQKRDVFVHELGKQKE